MRIVRSFSTSLRRTKQALYEPYVPRLNEEQKKALRKVIARSMPTFHGSLSKDINFFLQAYKVEGDTLNSRRKTLQRVTHIIQSAFGREYSVIDRSLHLYAGDYEYAPLELTVVDESRPQGIPLSTVGEPLPDAYKHETLAALLQKHGYDGVFVAGDAMRNLPSSDENASSVPPTVESRGPLPTTPPWPSYTPHPTFYLTHPPILFAEHPPQGFLSFFLSPPIPTHTHLIRLLRVYSTAFANLPQFITLIILWIRSIDLPEVTPMCVALMVIGWLQQRKMIPSLQNPSDPDRLLALANKDEGVWVRSELAGASIATWLETCFVDSLPERQPRNLGPLLHDFLKFWSVQGDLGFISSTQYLSVREGSVLPRHNSVVKRTRSAIDEDDRNIAQGLIPTSVNEQPVMWQTQPIVVQDPFTPSFNHAQSLSKAACGYFHYFCSLSSRTLARGHPLTAILGKSLPPPNRRVHRNLGFNQSYSTAPIEREIRTTYETSFAPPEPVLTARRMTISRVKNVIRRRFGNHYDVECFGSTRYGVGSATSDLDLVIIDRERMDGFSPSVNLKRLPDVYDIRLVSRTLYKNGFANVFAIPGATVPIVKFRDPITGLDCDLNTNDQLGLCNTRLVAQYCDLEPNLVRPMIMAVKRWAKSHGLNDPSGQKGPVTFSSYALVLMVIGYLQVKGALPNLQAGLTPLAKNANQGVFWMRTKKGDHVRCDTRFQTALEWSPKVHLDLGEAVVGWFSFWASEYKYAEQLLSIREGGLVQRAKKNKAKKSEKRKGITPQAEQEQQRAEDEDAIVAAFANQSESEESDDSEHDFGNEHPEDVEVIDIAAESEASHDTTDHNPREEAQTLKTVEVNSEAKHAESQRVHIPAAAGVGISPQEAKLGAEISLQNVKQSPKWNSHSLVVADPFILAKNVAGNIGKRNIERFRDECLRTASLLDWGGDLESLMGDGQPLPGTKPVRGRGAGRRGPGGRGGRGGGAGRGRGVDPAPGRGGDQRGEQDSGGGKGHPGHGRGVAHRGGPASRGAPNGPWRGPPVSAERQAEHA